MANNPQNNSLQTADVDCRTDSENDTAEITKPVTASISVEQESKVTDTSMQNANKVESSNVAESQEGQSLTEQQDERATDPPISFNVKSSLNKRDLVDRIKGVIYGNCIGDAIGLLTEFMTKSEAAEIYRHRGIVNKVKGYFSTSQNKIHLEYEMKNNDSHRWRWETGDWTDDSDQMILILQSLLDNKGKMVPLDFAKKMKYWSRRGFPELGDIGGMGIGSTTHRVLHHPDFLTDPHKAAEYVWDSSGRFVAPNGGVMRTSILGVHNFGDINAVIENTKAACKVTHADPRCIASCVAVTTAIAMMLQGEYFVEESGSYDVEALIETACSYASATLETEEQEEGLKKHVFAKSLKNLQLDEHGKIGYTYKCLGAGIWSLRQDDFRAAIEDVAFEAGDADTNGAVAGALLGCKLGASKLPESWLNNLLNKAWLDEKIERFLALLGLSE